MRGILRAAAVTLVALSAIAGGAFACDLPDMRTGERPDSLSQPTEITASFIVADILGVDDANQQINLDIFGTFSWRDPRLAGLDGCRYMRTQVWTPDVVIYNSSNLRAQRTNARDQVVIGEDGMVTYQQRFVGKVSSYHSLRRFPFDRHNFEISVGSIHQGDDTLIFRVDEENTWIASRLNIEGWDVTGVSIKAVTIERQSLGLAVSVLTLTISAVRQWDYYLYRVMAPLLLVVAMSWTIFWVPPIRFEFQIGLGATSMLTVIAFNLAVSGTLPRLGYLTLLDKSISWAILLVFLSIVEALITGRLTLHGNEERALQIDRQARVFFPVLLFVGWFVILSW
ncbi:MAG: hypothetical protein GY798_10865 [Hyphomicrobiales bacterium]|nr:hypothetical protein [Hyphomicrobiales bacterium]